MASLKRYLPHYVAPDGMHSPLGMIEAENDAEALHKLGHLIRERSDDLHRDGVITMSGPDGEDVSGSRSTVAEHEA